MVMKIAGHLNSNAQLKSNEGSRLFSTFYKYFKILNSCVRTLIPIYYQESILAMKGKFNFDHPDAFDNDLMEQCLKDIIGGSPTKVTLKLLDANFLVVFSFPLDLLAAPDLSFCPQRQCLHRPPCCHRPSF